MKYYKHLTSEFLNMHFTCPLNSFCWDFYLGFNRGKKKQNTKQPTPVWVGNEGGSTDPVCLNKVQNECSYRSSVQCV